jgi:hypothetical protein
MHATLLFSEYDHLGPVSATYRENFFRNIIYGPGKEHRQSSCRIDVDMRLITIPSSGIPISIIFTVAIGLLQGSTIALDCA